MGVDKRPVGVYGRSKKVLAGSFVDINVAGWFFTFSIPGVGDCTVYLYPFLIGSLILVCTFYLCWVNSD